MIDVAGWRAEKVGGNYVLVSPPDLQFELERQHRACKQYFGVTLSDSCTYFSLCNN